MFRRLKDSELKFEEVSAELHPEHETRNTRVSEYLRKYGQGKIDSMPTDNRPQVNDPRTADEMLADNTPEDHMAFDNLDAFMELERKKNDFEAAFKDIELTQKQKEKFDSAVAVLNDKNASYEQVKHAEQILEDLKESKKLKRVRD